MAVAYDAASSSSGVSVATLTWSHTCSGSDRVLYALLEFDATAVTVSSVTYNGAALTSVGRVAGAGSFGGVVEIWRRIAPSTGANNIVANFSANTDIVGGGHSFTGADQTTPNGTFTSATGTSTAPSVSITSASDEIVIDGVLHTHSTGGTPTLSVGAGQTQRWNATPSVWIVGGGSTEAGAGSVTMSWTASPSDPWAIAGVSVKPAAGGAVTTPPRPLIVRQAVKRAASW